MPALWSMLPILLLIYLMAKSRALPSHKALPLVAFIAAAIHIFILKLPVLWVGTAIINGLLTAWTPLSIVFGAMLLFRCMDVSGSMALVKQGLNHLSTHRIAQIMIVAWSFSFLIEGASGFGTPAALAAPILVGMGIAPLHAAILALVMNSVPVCFGAVGTPLWFGLSNITLSDQEFMAVCVRVGWVQAICGLFLPAVALRLIMPWSEIRPNLGFVLLSSLGCVLPMLAASSVSAEFPALVGGACGLPWTLWIAHKGWGLARPSSPLSENVPSPSSAGPSTGSLIKALFPIWGSLLLLLLTRWPESSLQSWLRDGASTWLELNLLPVGTLTVSPSLVVTLNGMFGIQESIGTWRHELLYIPSILPFVLVSLMTMRLFKQPWKAFSAALSHSAGKLAKPLIALSGALVLVKVLMLEVPGEQPASTQVIGEFLAYYVGDYWNLGAVFLGALGSFFSGSATISNLTFADIQLAIAQTPGLGLSKTNILALQCVGAALGNMVCIHNIVAVCSVLGLENKEGQIFRQTIRPMFGYALLALTVSQLLPI